MSSWLQLDAWFCFSQVFRKCSLEGILDRCRHKQMPKLPSRCRFFFLFFSTCGLTWLLMCLLPTILPSILFYSSVCPNHNKTLSPQWLGPRKSARPASSVPSCLPPAKQRSLPFCCRWGGLLRRLRAVFQQHTLLSAPHSEKANSTQRIDGIGKEGRCQCGGCWIPGNYKQSFFPEGAGTDGHKGDTSQANVKSK